MKPVYTVGDVVKLKGQSIPMTIISSSEGRGYLCAYGSTSGIIMFDSFPEATLEKIERQPQNNYKQEKR